MFIKLLKEKSTHPSNQEKILLAFYKLFSIKKIDPSPHNHQPSLGAFYKESFVNKNGLEVLEDI